jgi:dolichol-phosphate mannosyltransferase
LRKNFGWARRAIVSFSYAPLDFIISMALLVVGASALALLVSVGLKIAFPSAAPKGATTLIVLVLFIGGMQLLCISIVGSYLAAMFEEIKSRPAYVVDEILNDPAQRPPSARREQEPAERVANTPRHPAGADP